jgi:hypothetical protein
MKRMTRQGHTLTHPPATTVRLNNTASSRSMWACRAGGGVVTCRGRRRRSFDCWREGPHSGGSGSRGGSQESLLGPDRGAPGERRGSHERARMVQGPVPGQARVSALAPVRVGWLPVQRRVSGIGDPPQGQTPRAESQPSAQVRQVVLKLFIPCTTTENIGLPKYYHYDRCYKI